MEEISRPLNENQIPTNPVADNISDAGDDGRAGHTDNARHADHAGSADQIITTNCPKCEKSYSVARRALTDELAIFKCRACAATFYFAIEQIHGSVVESLELDLPEFELSALDFQDSSDAATSGSAGVASVAGGVGTGVSFDEHASAGGVVSGSAPVGGTTRNDLSAYGFEFGVGPGVDAQTSSGYPHAAYVADARAVEGGRETASASPSTERSLGATALANARAMASQSSRICPKCHASNSPSSENCEVCGINFLKYEILQKDGGYLKNANKALYRQWQHILTHYDDSAAHEQFIMMCSAKGQMPFAARCYARVLEVWTSDETAQARLRQIEAMAHIPFSIARSRNSKSEGPLKRHSFTIVYCIGGLLVSAGFFLPHSRNLVGAGVALLIVAYGVQTWLKSESV